MGVGTYRSLGLTVPVSEVLDPKLWRERYAYNLFTGPLSPAVQNQERDELHDLMCVKPSGPKTAGARAAVSQAELTELVEGLPDETIRWHLRVALSAAEAKLGIPMGTVVVKTPPVDEGLIKGVHYDRVEPRRPFVRSNQSNWWKFELPTGLISVERVRAYWYDVLVWEISEEQGNLDLLHIQWQDQGGSHIIPAAGFNLLITAPGFSGAWGSGNYGAFQLLHHGLGNQRLPNVWGYDYTIGPYDKHTNTPGQIEAILAHWCYCEAAMTLLSIEGMGRSQGVSNASVSIDGLSRSVGLTASAIYGLNSALEEALKRASERIDFEALRTYKKGLKVYPFGH